MQKNKCKLFVKSLVKQMIFTIFARNSLRIMTAKDTTLTTFTTRVRQMILKYQEVRKENSELYAMVDERDKEIAELKKSVSEWEKEYKALKMAKMIEVTDGDLEAAKNRISKLVRDVNQCITLLSDN